MSRLLIEIMPEPDGKTLAYSPDVEAFKFKGTTLTIIEIILLTSDLDIIGQQLAQKMTGKLGLFRNTPVVVNLEAPEIDPDLDMVGLLALLRSFDLIPIGVRQVKGNLAKAVRATGLGVIPERKSFLPEPRPGNGSRVVQELQEDVQKREKQGIETPKAEPSQASPPNQPSPSLIVSQPVRSGQRVYAAGGDLILLAAVNAGAEVLADGNIHAYAPLRGRVLAGARGNVNASIFCQSLEAELVSIAGYYQIIEDMPPEALGKPVQISLEGDRLKFIHLYEKSTKARTLVK
jgi:septum site-determining protein MinC